jgi:hypothetical protein
VVLKSATIKMANTFDHEDKDSWYFGPIGRKEATDLLMAERGGGVFLVRDSATCVGDYVLCVKYVIIIFTKLALHLIITGKTVK